MDFESWLSEQVEGLQREELLRAPQLSAEESSECLNFGSNDYLALARSRTLGNAFAEAAYSHGFGSGSARLLSGTSSVHTQLEDEIAEYLGRETSVSFSSGYLANCAMMSAGRSRHDTIIADKYVHASILDGARCSGSKIARFRHNDLDQLRALLAESSSRTADGRTVVVTESVFSMDGDFAPLKDICALCEEFGADVFVDEAHAFGVFGPNGSGRVAEEGCRERVQLVSVTLSKAAGGYGGAVAGIRSVQQWLYSTARQFIFQTSLPPAVAAADVASLRMMREMPGAGAELLRRAARFRSALVDAGCDCGSSRSQIVPLIVGDTGKARKLSDTLRQKGIFVPYIRTPTVPVGSERMRFSITLAHSEERLAEAAEEVVRCARECGVL